MLLLFFATIHSKAQLKVDQYGNVKMHDAIWVVKYMNSAPMIYSSQTGNSYLGYYGNMQWTHIHGQSIWGNGVFLGSDLKLKENLRGIDSPLSKILQLSGKKYDFKINAVDTCGTEYENKKNTAIKKDRLGFIAQEVKKVLPEAVIYDEETDQYYIEYDALIPVLVEAMKEQQTKIEEMEARIDKLEGKNKEKSAGVGTGNTAINTETATLAQNIPNPFSSTTSIGIYLPQTVSNARLYVYNMQGAQIRSFNINERGNTSVTIEGYSLEAGMYLYTLIADGKEVDTKKMILTK